MKKKILMIIIFIIAIILFTLGILYSIDMDRMKNNEPVLFSTWGYKYSPPLKQRDKQEDDNKQETYSFFATVIESSQSYIIVKPVEGSEELKSSDKISISLGEKNDALYEVGTALKITYNGIILETYPAQIRPSKIEIKTTDNFELIFKGRKDLGIKTILLKDETDKYTYSIYSYAGDVSIKIDDKEYTLREALFNNKITMDEIIAKANQDAFQDKTIKVDSVNDGGTNIYHYDNYNIIKYHLIEGNRDVYIGTTYMGYDIKEKNK